MQEALFRKRKKKKNRTGRKGFFYHSAKKIPIQLWSIKEWTFRISRIGDDSKDLRPPTSLPFCLLTLEFPEALRFKETKYPLGSWGRMDTCLCMTESLHCSSETITAVSVNWLYSDAKLKFMGKKKSNAGLSKGKTRNFVDGVSGAPCYRHLLKQASGTISFQVKESLATEPVMEQEEACATELFHNFPRSDTKSRGVLLL